MHGPAQRHGKDTGLHKGYALAVSAALFGAVAMAAPLAAQGQSEGYKFLESVRDREGTVATEMLAQPGNTLVNTRDIGTGETAMHVVTQRRDLTWIRFLLQKGADPDIADRKGVTPLQIASQLGFLEGVELLAEAGAAVDRPNAAGETALISAVHRRDVAMIRVLVEHGADPRRTDNSGRTALDYAALIGGNGQVLEVLEAAVADKDEAGAVYGPS